MGKLQKNRKPVEVREIAKITLKNYNEDVYLENESQGQEALDDYMTKTLNELLQMSSDTVFSDTMGLFELTETKEFQYIIDSVFGLTPENRLVVVLIQCFEDTGYDWDNKIILWEADPQSNSGMWCFKDGLTFRIKKQEDIIRTNFVLAIVLEIFNDKDQFKVEQQGFTLLPIKSQEYFLSGVYQMPLIRENLSFKELDLMQRRSMWELQIDASRKLDGGTLKPVKGSLICRIGLVELLESLPEPNDVSLINSMFMNKNIAPDKIFTEENIGMAKETKKVGEILSKDTEGKHLLTILQNYILKVLMTPEPGYKPPPPPEESEEEPEDPKAAKKKSTGGADKPKPPPSPSPPKKKNK